MTIIRISERDLNEILTISREQWIQGEAYRRFPFRFALTPYRGDSADSRYQEVLVDIDDKGKIFLEIDVGCNICRK